MEYWLSWQNNTDRLRLPVVPAELTITRPNTNTTVNINDLGDLKLIGKTGLATINLESFFPAREYPFCQYAGFPAPYDCIALIEKWQASSKPIRLIVTETPLNIALAIESFEYGEKDGTGDVHFTLSCEEYRFTPPAQKAEEQKPTGATIAPPAATRACKDVPAGTEYIVKKGDTLWLIAKKQTGNGANYTAIAKKNNLANASLIQPGQKLVIG